MANKARIEITFRNISCSGTWTRSGTTITVSFNDHEMGTNQVINVTSIDGSQTTGNKLITYIGTDEFSFVGINGGDVSGTLTYTRGTGDVIAISCDDGNTVNLYLTSNTVGGQGYFNIGTSNSSCAANYVAAINRDYGVGGLISNNNLIATALDNVVTIESLDYTNAEGTIFSFATDDAIWHSMVAYDEVLPTASIKITDVTYSEAASNPCVNIRRTIVVEDAVYPVTITNPTTKVCANSGELWFDHLRSWSGTISVTDDDSQDDSIAVPIVEAIASVDTRIVYGNGFVNVFIGVGVYSDDVTVIPITLEYSLDDVTYQSSNAFYGLFTGEYPVYVRDQYGCTKTAEFEVVAIPDPEKPEPFFDISLNQSFQVRENRIRDFDTSFPNMFEDQYSENEFVNRAYKGYAQKLKLTDTRKIQIRSTYDTVNLDVYSIDDPYTSLDTLTFTKIIENIGLKDARDCIVKSGGNNRTYVYFTSGSTYDYDTGDPLVDYTLNGSLEYWMTKESVQNIQITDHSAMNGQYEITGYGYDTTVNASVLIIESTYTGDPNEACIAKFVYNSEDFDIYETSLIANDYGEGCYFFTIAASDTDPRYENKDYISEPFEIITTLKSEDGAGRVIDDLVLIKWADTTVVNDLDFRTEIENGIRIEGTFYDFSIEGDKEVFDDDDGDIFPLKATKKRLITLKTHDLPPYLIDLICTAVTEHKYVLINGIQVQTKEYPSIESIDQGSTQTLSVACQVMNTTTYISNDITGENINYNVLGTVYSTTKKVLGV